MPDPDLDIKGGSSRPLDKGGRAVSKKISLSGPQFGLRIRGGTGPFSGSATVMTEKIVARFVFRGMISVWGFLTGEFHANRDLSTILGGTPYDGLYWEAPPERGTFFRPQVYKI